MSADGQACQAGAFSASVQGATFVAWFERHTLAACELDEHVNSVPLSRIYEVIDETRRRIDLWESFATTLAQRTRPSGR